MPTDHPDNPNRPPAQAVDPCEETAILQDGVGMVDGHPAGPGTWTYIGCFVDSGDRDLTGPSSAVASVPFDAANECAANCVGYTYIGLQWSNECFCSNVYGNQGEAEITDCDEDGVLDDDGTASLCANGVGNCGWRNAVYSLGGGIDSHLGNYANGQDCRWLLTCNDGAVPTVQFSSFQTESNFDYVNLYDGGEANEGALIVRCHGTECAATQSPSGSMLMQLTTDGSVVQDGFVAAYTCGAPVGGQACGSPGSANLAAPGPGYVVEVGETVTYEQGSTDYTNCVWTPGCDSGVGVFEFSSFLSEGNWDWLNLFSDTSLVTNSIGPSVHNGGVDNSGDLGRFSGSDEVGTVEFVAAVQYISDWSYQEPGAGVVFTLTECSPDTDPCLAAQTYTDPGSIDSHTDVTYENSQDCRWILTCGAGEAPSVTFSSYQTEQGWDFVDMWNGAAPEFSYLGCFVDSGDRDLTGPQGSVASNPVDAAFECMADCAGYAYFGLQYSNECFCSDTYGNQGEADIADCDDDGIIMDGVADKCGNGDGDCGWRNAVYEIGPSELLRCHGSSCDGTTARGNQMLVQLVTDGSVVQEGFVLDWTCGEPAAPPPPLGEDPNEACGDPGGGNLAEPGAYIVADGEQWGYTQGSTDYTNCVWTMSCTGTVTFTEFSSEGNWDWLNVFSDAGLVTNSIGPSVHNGGVDNSGDLGRFSGNDDPGAISGVAAVQYISDWSYQEPGAGFVATLNC
jgi:hypothetical protein